MKIAILTSGIIPVPAVQGGAVENLVDYYLAYNDLHQKHEMTIYSVWHPGVENHPALKSSVNHYVFLKTNTLKAKYLKKLLHFLQRKHEYYDYTIEYYLHEVIKIIRKQHFDCIIIENRPAFALKLKKITEAKLVYHLHNDILNCQTSHAQEIYNAASRIITVSDYIKSRVQTINLQDDKTITVHNGINLDAFSPKKGISRDKLGINADDFVLVFSGRIAIEKGISEILEAMELLKDYHSIKLLVLGSAFYAAESKDGFAKNQRLKAEQMKGKIVFTGFIPYSDMPNYLQIADVAVIPSVWDDPFPTSVLEAQSMGLPIIATRRGGIPEEVSQDNAILLNIDSHFVENLAATILNLYNNPAKRQAMSQASLSRANLFSKEAFAEEFHNSIL